MSQTSEKMRGPYEGNDLREEEARGVCFNYKVCDKGCVREWKSVRLGRR